MACFDVGGKIDQGLDILLRAISILDACRERAVASAKEGTHISEMFHDVIEELRLFIPITHPFYCFLAH